MFDSIAGGIIPVCLLAAFVGFALSQLRSRLIALALASLGAVAVSYAWFWLPRVLGIGAHADPQGGWDLVATVAWSVLSVPAAVISQIVGRKWRLEGRG
jgi:hypothetical protein